MKDSHFLTIHDKVSSYFIFKKRHVKNEWLIGHAKTFPNENAKTLPESNQKSKIVVCQRCHILKFVTQGRDLRSTVNRVSSSVPFSSIQQSSEIWTTPLSSTELSSTSITPKCMLSSPMTNRAQSRSTEVPPKCQLSYSVEQFRSTDRRQNAPCIGTTCIEFNPVVEHDFVCQVFDEIQ